MLNSREKLIKKAIPDPGIVPLNSSSQEVKEEQFKKISVLMSKGVPASEAIRKVTGSSPKINVDKKIQNSRNKKKNIAIASILSVALAATGVWGVSHTYGAKPIDALTGASSEDVKAQPLDGDKMILVAGKDERGQTAISNEGTVNDVPGVRTDVLSLVSIPKDGSRAIAVSIPRDTLVNKPDCQLYDYNSQKYLDADSPPEDGVKINSIYQEGGAKCLVKTVEKATGVKVNGYAEIGFDSFASVVDSLGGIEVKEDAPLYDDTLGQITTHGGVVNLNGKQALDYVRARKVEGTSKSDFDRINRQQKFMSSLLTELRNKAGGSNSDKLSFIKDMTTDVLPKTKTDGISSEEAISLLSSLMSMDSSSIRMTTIPITDDSINTNDLIIDEVKSKDLFNKLVNHIPLEGDAPVSGSDNTYKAKEEKLSQKPIIIVARSKYDDRANNLKKRLSKSGALVSVIESQKIPDNSVIQVDNSNKNVVASLLAMYPNVTVTPNVFDDSLPNNGGAAIMTVGNDFDRAYKFVNSFNEGSTVYIPKDRDMRAGSVIPQKIPGSSGKRDIDSLR